MSAPNSSSRRSLLAAFLVAAAVLVAAGEGFRALAAVLGRGGQPGVIRSEDLARLPLSMGSWRGRDDPIDKDVAAYTNADALLCRIYSNGSQAVVLYVAGGVRARDMMPHRPYVCYPSHGWTQQGDRLTQVKLTDGSTLPCRVYTFGKGGLSSQVVKVLNYYIIDGRYGQDVSALREQVRFGSDAVQYLAQVQLSCTVGSMVDASQVQETLEQFMAQAGPLIMHLMPGSGVSPASCACQPATGPVVEVQP